MTAVGRVFEHVGDTTYGIKRDFCLAEVARSTIKQARTKEIEMWEKPEFEVIETCCEVSAYVYPK
jgi:hypothetical protein